MDELLGDEILDNEEESSLEISEESEDDEDASESTSPTGVTPI